MPIISGSGSSGGGGVSRLYTTTLGADAASIDTGANGIAGSATHLHIVCAIRSARAANTFDTLRFQFNADTGTNYNSTLLFGQGTAASSSFDAAGVGVYAECPAATAPAGWFGAIVIAIPQYTSTTPRKQCVVQFDYVKALSSGNVISATLNGTWNSTAAITRLTIVSGNSANILAGSQISIYGMT